MKKPEKVITKIRTKNGDGGLPILVEVIFLKVNLF